MPRIKEQQSTHTNPPTQTRIPRKPPKVPLMQNLSELFNVRFWLKKPQHEAEEILFHAAVKVTDD